MSDELSQEAGWEPNFPRLRRLDELWYKGERLLCGGMFLLMSLMVFAAVITDVFGTRRSPIDLLVTFGLVWLGVRTRSVKDGETRPGHGKSLAMSAVITAAIAGVVYAYTEVYPGGFVWAQKLALVMMLWVALLGASLATFERAHLSLEMGEKIWPRGVLHIVKAMAHGVTSAFCVVLLLLSIRMVGDQLGWGSTVKANDWLPMWLALAILPYTFLAMSVRLLAQTFTLATRRDKPVSEQLPT